MDAVLITGGARGLGEVLVRAFHGVGWRVAVSDIDGDAAHGLAISLDASGKTALGLALDVRMQTDFEAARDVMLDRWGVAHALVNNAVVTRAQPVLDIAPDDFSAVVEVNLRGTFVGSQVFGRLFKACGYGRIVNIASLAGQNGGTATGAHYAASKGGIITLTKVFARDLAPFGVAVSAIAPGPLDLPSVRELVPAEALTALTETIPVRQLGDPGFIARTAVHLAGRDAAFANGATWDANGGLFMR